MTVSSVLFVEPDLSLRRGWNLAAGNRYLVACASDGASAVLHASGNRIDVLVTAATLPDTTSADLIQRVQRLHPSVITIVMASDEHMDAAIACLELGAVELLRRPFTTEALRRALRIASAIAPAGVHAGDGPVVAESVAMQHTIAQLRALADHPTPVLLAGESGTGLEAVARLLHSYGPAASGPFVVADCSTISEAALDSALFGHTSGWLSAGQSRRPSAPTAGTLFLNQIEALSLPLQSKLLRSLKHPHASSATVRASLRVVASTHADLDPRMDAGTFLPELAYRLCVARVEVAPLRHRAADVSPLATLFVREFCAEAGLPRKRLSGDAIELLEAYSWPGNLGELRATIERAAALTGDATVILPEDLPAAIAAERPAATQIVPFHLPARRSRMAPASFVAPGTAPRSCHPVAAPNARSDGKWTPQLWACVHPFPTLRASGPDANCEGCPIWEELCRQRVASGA